MTRSEILLARRSTKPCKKQDKVMKEGRERVLNLRGRRAPRVSLADVLAEVGHQLRDWDPANFQVSVQGRPRPLYVIRQEEILLIGREELTYAFTHSGEGGRISKRRCGINPVRCT